MGQSICCDNIGTLFNKQKSGETILGKIVNKNEIL